MQFELTLTISAKNIHVLSSSLAASCRNCVNNNTPCTIGEFDDFLCPFSHKGCAEVDAEDWEALLNPVDNDAK